MIVLSNGLVSKGADNVRLGTMLRRDWCERWRSQRYGGVSGRSCLHCPVSIIVLGTYVASLPCLLAGIGGEGGDPSQAKATVMRDDQGVVTS